MTISKNRSNVIRGLAILAVMIVHIMAFFQGIFTVHGFRFMFVAFDQLLRFCVPAFIILSGYGLMAGYGDKNLSWWEFFRGRLIKLLPLYLLWSIFSIFVFWFIPEWAYYNRVGSVWIHLLFGQADYHLYFLPIIFQLYALFPFIAKRKKHLIWWVIISLFLQIFSFSLFGSSSRASERFEYGLFTSWIFYFVFGMWLNRDKNLIKTNSKWQLLGVATSLALVVLSSWFGINNGIDPLLALKFTRPEIVLYGTTITYALISLSFMELGKTMPWISKLLGTLGKYSYLVYLSHVMLFRIIYSVIVNQVDFWKVALVLLVWMGLVKTSNRMINK